jgi:hypothetical protein
MTTPRKARRQDSSRPHRETETRRLRYYPPVFYKVFILNILKEASIPGLPRGNENIGSQLCCERLAIWRQVISWMC